MWLTPYLESELAQDAVATAVALTACLTWLKAIDSLVDSGHLETRLSRKVIHCGTGPIFMLTWDLFSASPWAPYAAALVPFLITFQFTLIGLGVVKDPRAIASMTRRGDPKEILLGPVFYGLTFVIVTILFWRHSPTGILALIIICAGDGLAEIVGRRYGRVKLPFSKAKSWAGSAAMLGGSFFFGFSFLALMNHFGNFSPPLDLLQTSLVVFAISLVATLVEAVPVAEIDNITIPLASLTCGLYCEAVFHWGQS